MRFCIEKNRMDETKTPTRDDIPEADKWDLSLLFSRADKWSEDFAWIRTTLPRLANRKGCVGESLLRIIELRDEQTAFRKVRRSFLS